MLAVKSGWQGFEEVNRVVFDPRWVTVQQMVGWLKETGTYVRTIEDKSTPAAPDEQQSGKP